MTEILPDYAVIDAEFTPERLNAMSMEERVSEPMVAFSRRRHDDGAAHVAWWLWRTQERNANIALRPSQGSMFFLDCGRGAFAVTADHVYEGFLEDRAERRVRSCQIGNVAFDDPEDPTGRTDGSEGPRREGEAGGRSDRLAIRKFKMGNLR